MKFCIYLAFKEWNLRWGNSEIRPNPLNFCIHSSTVITLLVYTDHCDTERMFYRGDWKHETWQYGTINSAGMDNARLWIGHFYLCCNLYVPMRTGNYCCSSSMDSTLCKVCGNVSKSTFFINNDWPGRVSIRPKVRQNIIGKQGLHMASASL